jgi:steroid delta-isomerase-like uncharacterized protein
MDLSAYTLETLHQDREFVLCRGRDTGSRTLDPPSVLVKMTASEHPAPDRVRMLEHELALRAELDSTWAVRPLALSQYHGRAALILEDQSGEPLTRLLGMPLVSRPHDGPRSSELAMEQGLFLRLAVGLADALGGVHRRGIIHKDVKPAHVLANAVTGQVWLTGFGIASHVPRERQAPHPPENLAGTLAYMAPEQTGCMNRSIDCRSDLYALGVTLYEMLTGSLPFTAAEPIEWVHCHIAREPIAPGERVAKVPAPVSAIIMKLLAKTAEDRYQTAAGLERDLRRCQTQWHAERRIDDFPLGEHDISDRLLIPEKLYGRTRDVETMLAAFDRVVHSGAPELVLVSGYSGIGKSSVVHELHKVLVPPRALFAAGKFDQYKRDIPYSTLAQAFHCLIRPLLTKSDDELSRWRQALLEAIVPNGQLMVDLVPDLKIIVGEQAPVSELPPQDAQRRFHLVLRRFLGVFARPEHPLAVFLDDLQWLDVATLDLLQDLMIQGDVRHLLLIGAYRNNEVTAAHPLMRRLEAIRGTDSAPVQEITLAPLGRDDVCRLIADSLYCDGERALNLATLVHEKTAGNPFFAIQFLSALVEEALVTFDHGEGRWCWDLTRIHAKGCTDNVIDLMVGKLRRLPTDTQRALRHLACLGNSADTAVLALAHEDSKEALDRDMRYAQQLGLVFQSEDAYRFLHDRVQDAAYSLIPEAERAEAHLRIGRMLAANTPLEKREEAIFEIVNQLNRAAALISSRAEQEQLAEFNLIAGKRAKASTAYASALTYLVVGTSLLSDHGWEHRPDLMFALELYRAECEFLTGELASAETRLTMLSSRAVTPVDRANVTCLHSDVYTTLDRSDRAVEVCLDYLRRLGIEWSPHPTQEEVRREYARTWTLLGRREIEELIDLPLMSDPEAGATMEVLTKAWAPATFTDTNLQCLVLWRMVNLSLEFGNAEASCQAYALVFASAGPHFGNYQAGHRFGQLGYDLVERRGFKRFQARTYMAYGVGVVSEIGPLRAASHLFRQGFEAANTAGDLTFAAFSWIQLVAILRLAGEPLVDAQREAERGLEFAKRAHFGLAIDIIASQLAVISTLRGLTETFGCFNGEQFDEIQMEHRLGSDPRLAFPEWWYWTQKLQARFFAGDYASAVDASRNVQRLLGIPDNLETAEAHFYSALSHAAACDRASPVEYREHIEALAEHHRQLQTYAGRRVARVQSRVELVNAEIARVEGRELDAERLYEVAIDSARDKGFVQNEALANELAARFYAARGLEEARNLYLGRARAAYLRWGADGKVRQLDQQSQLGQDRPDAAFDVASFINQYYRAWQGTDQDRIISFYTDDVTVQIPGSLMQGKAALREQFVRPFITAFPGNRHVVKKRIGGRDAVIVEFDFEAEHTGAFAGHAATHARVVLPGCGVYEYDSAKRQITAARIYFDRGTLLKQILDQRAPGVGTEEVGPGPTGTIAASAEHLDLATVIAVSQAVSGEMVLERLLDTLMRTAVEYAGAERALLILSHTAEPRIMAESTTDPDTITVRLCDEPVAASVLPETVLRHVLRTRESVILDDAAGLNPFSPDPYLAQRHVRSMFCLPLMNQAKLIGVLYLENNLAAGAFAPARTAVLKLLASQAAISLDNARLYRDLGERERESRLVVETIPGFVASLSPAGEVEFVNNGLIEYCGQGLDAMKQWGTNGTVHVDDLPHVAELFTQGITSGEPYHFDARIRRSDGIYRWFQVRGLPLRDVGGQIVRWYSLLVDIDDRKRAETELTAIKDQLYKENLVLRDEVDRTSMFEEIVGTSAALQPALSRVAKVAPTDSTVLITGETGTGKELVARAIHRRSPRSSRAFVSVNCAAVPRELIASELFGHEKGAFTGATQRRLGRFELAHGGTLFLDEVGELPMETQVALLRVLQERAFERVGGSAAVEVDVRVVAATNRDLEAAIEAGTFRRDLFYRLNVFPIAVPPLRERADDIPLLVEYFIDRYARKAGKTIRRVNKRTLDHLRSYPWPGNVRELQNVIERSVIICDTDEFRVDESWVAARPTVNSRVALPSTLAGREKALIEEALRASDGRVFGPSGAAARLGIARSTLESKIRALKIDKSRFRGRPVKER